MESKLTTIAETEEFLKSHNLEYKMVTHDAVPTVKDMIEKVHFEEETTFAKNLFLKDKKKKDLYLVIAKHDTAINLKTLAKHLGTASSNLRAGDEDKMWEYLSVKPGAVNIFSILNDSEKKVNLIVDQIINDAELISAHPMENVATCQLSNAVFKEIIKLSNHEVSVLDFATLEESVKSKASEKKEKDKAPGGKAKKQKSKAEGHELSIQYKKNEDFANWYT